MGDGTAADASEANHARLTFPDAVAVLRTVEPNLQAFQLDWLTIAEALAAAEPGATVGSAGLRWVMEATLRSDDGPEPEHPAAAVAFVAAFPDWLVEIDLPGNPHGLGRHQRRLVLLETPQFLKLLAPLFTDTAPAVWTRAWPNLPEAAIDVDRPDTCCNVRPRYCVELLRGRHEDTESQI